MALWRALGLAALLAPTCGMPTQNGGDDAGPPADASDAGAPDATTDATGTGCFRDAQTNVVLCTGSSACPGLTVSSDVYPNCGFRVHGQAIDLACVCGDELCSMGATSTCDQAAQLLSQGNEATVCAEVSAGACILLTSSASSSSGGSTCDPSCEMECGGDPGCITLCGC